MLPSSSTSSPASVCAGGGERAHRVGPLTGTLPLPSSKLAATPGKLCCKRFHHEHEQAVSRHWNGQHPRRLGVPLDRLCSCLAARSPDHSRPGPRTPARTLKSSLMRVAGARDNRSAELDSNELLESSGDAILHALVSKRLRTVFPKGTAAELSVRTPAPTRDAPEDV